MSIVLGLKLIVYMFRIITQYKVDYDILMASGVKTHMVYSSCGK